jgi:hypothetical protein
MRGAGGDISSIEVTMSTTNALAGSAPTDPEDHILVLRARSGDRAALSADFERSFDPRASSDQSGFTSSRAGDGTRLFSPPAKLAEDAMGGPLSH